VKNPSIWAVIWQKLNAHESLEKETDMLLDHAYDGIQELDNRLPPWWLYGFYVSIFAGVIYLFNYHIFGYSPLMDQAYEIEMAEAQAATEAYLASLALNVDERTVEFVWDAGRLSQGAGLFDKHCKACHAADGGGGVGPNLTDNYWLHGGQISDLFSTIKYGVPAKGMKAWKADLTPTEIQNVATYILSLNGTTPAAPKDPQGNFEEPAQPIGAEANADATAAL
jgi:cytochrome c oxidase cbb3-type subunit 3